MSDGRAEELNIRGKQTRINEQIQAKEVRLIDHDGHQQGIVAIDEALSSAKASGFDLVEISPTADPPVCRVMDFGKYAFEQSKRRAAAKKKQKVSHVKEVKFRPGTDIGDYNVKVRKIRQFLLRGDKVKVSLRFRGREMQHRELGMDLLNRIQGDLSGVLVEQEPKLEGRQLMMVVSQGKLVAQSENTESSESEGA